MADSGGRKLVVEVCNAKNLMPKDGQGTASAYVTADYDGQRRRTRTIFRDLNPQWDEKLEFVVHDPGSMANELLEVNLYNDKKTGKMSKFLGKVKISGSQFAAVGSELLIFYPLEKRSVFSQIKGEIGLKVWYEDPPAPASETSPPKDEKKQEAPAAETAAEGASPANEEEKKTEETEEKPKEEEKEKPSETPLEAPPAPELVSAEVEKPKEEVGKEIVEKKSNTVAATGGELELRSLASDRRPGRGGADLVDPMPFLYVRVLKAKCPNPEVETLCFAKLVIGTHSIKTRSQGPGKDWDQVFAFDKEGLNSTSLEVSVWTEKKENDSTTATCLGTVSFDLQEVPKRVPPDSPLAPQWYTLEGSSEPEADVMVSVWFGTQADEVFQEAWQSDSGGFVPETRAKVYLSPKLWYLRLTVIQTQDLQLSLGSDLKSWATTPELYVKGQLGAQVFKTTRTSAGPTDAPSNPTWNEDLIFVASEPFEPFLVITVENFSNGVSVGQTKVHVASIERRTDDRTDMKSRWFNLVGLEDNKPYAGRIHVRVCLEGGYHVLDEAAHVTSDVRASAKQLARAPIGLLEVGVRGANNLLPAKTKDGMCGTTDAYVVAKYGPKWVRTRTILDRFNPRWNEQYKWDVYDPCTVLTIGVFDNGRYKKDESGKPGKDVRIGKLRIRLSTLDTNRIYVNTHYLMVLHPGGAKRMGEIEIAVRFSCTSWISLIQAYYGPMLPRMHYVRPLCRAQQDILRHTAMRIVIARLARSEPPLGQEVVQFMLDSDTHIWSMRKSKVNWFRVASGLSKLAIVVRWINGIRTWAHPSTTILAHMILVAVVLCPNLVLPTLFMYAFLILALRIRYRRSMPLSMDPRLSCIDAVTNDELDEEFDGFPSTRPVDLVRIRYDRIRALAGRAQSFLGDMAAQWERVEALYNWRDPRAAGICLVFCLVASLVFYILPFKAFVLGFGFYYFRHPKFRDDMPSVPANFFRRLPSLSDQII